jgi:hypothetical protein
MSAILALDAAWTAHEPTGVALLETTDAGWRCVAVAPSYLDFLLLADGQPLDWARPAISGSLPNPALLLQAAGKLLGGRAVDLVTVDMPMSTMAIRPPQTPCARRDHVDL